MTAASRSDADARSPVRSGLFRLDDLSIEGSSRAGEETWFRVRPPGLAFDAGRGPLSLIGVADLFLTHGHMDHAAGIPFLLSQRSLHGLGETRVHCPEDTAAALEDLARSAERLEGRGYELRVVPLAPGDRVEMGDFEVEAFATDHVVPSLGFHLWRRKRRLAERFRGLSSRRIVELKDRGVEVTRVDAELWLTYCGDSGPGVFDLEPRLFEARVLLIECTFLDGGHRESAREYGHLHIGDLVERAASFRNEALLLHHLSRRHRLADLRAEVDRALPELAPRVHLLGEGGPSE